MIVYFADRNLNIQGLASSHLPEGLRLSDDLKTEDLESGTSSFECTVTYSDGAEKSVCDIVTAGSYLLRSSEGENEFYTIIETEKDTLSQTIRVYSEDAGLDLINTVVSSYESSSSLSADSYIKKFLPAGWETGAIEASGTRKLKWDGESTVTERLISIANSFDCDISYSFEIKMLKITHKYVNLHKHRGEDEAKRQLFLNKDIKRIVTKSSTANLATALSVTGGTPSGKSTPVNLKGYEYSYTDIDGDEYAVDKATGQMRNLSAMRRWAGVLDSDGLILRRYTYDSTDKAKIAGAARAELKKMCREEVNYEIDFFSLDAKLGDRLNIIDDDGGVYLDARILKLSRSVCSCSVSATLGEYIIRDSGISERLSKLASEIKNSYIATSVLNITSSNGTVFQKGSTVATKLSVSISCGQRVIRDIESLYEVYGDDVVLVWYENGTRLLSSDFRIEDNGFSFNIESELTDEKVKYECRLEG